MTVRPLRAFLAGVAVSATAFAIAWLTLGSHHPSVASLGAPPAAQRGVSWGRTGPWGRQRTYSLDLDPPAEFQSPEQCPVSEPLWRFAARTAAELDGALAGVGVSPEDRATLLAAASCESDGCRTTPDAELVLGLAGPIRPRLYAMLRAAGGNYDQTNAFPIPGGDIDRWLLDSGLPGNLGEVVRRLTYPVSGRQALADLWILCQRSTLAGRTAIMRALTHTRGQSVVLEIDEDRDPETLIRYWSTGGSAAHAQRVRTLLTSAAHGHGGTTLSLLDLLPPFARLRLNTFADPRSPPWNCHWTALNFFAEGAPDDRYMDEPAALASLAADFEAIKLTDAGFGDLVLLKDSSGKVVHSGVYLADGMVFHKPGAVWTRPFAVTTIDQLLDVYFQATDLAAVRRKAR